MIVVCEKCETRFRLAADRLADGSLRVRCSRCGHVFVVTPGDTDAREDSLDPTWSFDVSAPGEADRGSASDAAPLAQAEPSAGPEATGVLAERDAGEGDLAEPEPEGAEAEGHAEAEGDWEFDAEGLFLSDPSNEVAVLAQDLGVDASSAEAVDAEVWEDDLDALGEAGAGGAQGVTLEQGPLVEAVAPSTWVWEEEPQHEGPTGPVGSGSQAGSEMEQAAEPPEPLSAVQPLGADVQASEALLGSALPPEPGLAIGAARARASRKAWPQGAPQRAPVGPTPLTAALGWALTALLAATLVATGLVQRTRAGAFGSLPAGELEARGVHGRWVENAPAGTLWVVSGELANTGPTARAPGRLDVRLLDARGGLIPDARAALGPELARADLRREEPALLRQRLIRAGGVLARTPITPGSTLRFDAVFEDVPERAHRYRIDSVPEREAPHGLAAQAEGAPEAGLHGEHVHAAGAHGEEAAAGAGAPEEGWASGSGEGSD